MLSPRCESAQSTYAVGKVSENFPVSLLDSLKTLSEWVNVPLAATLSVAYHVLFYRYSRADSTSSQSAQSENEGAQNALFSKGHLAANPSFLQLLKEISGPEINASSTASLSTVVAASQDPNNLDPAPLLKIRLALQDALRPQSPFPAVDLSSLVPPMNDLSADFTLVVFEDADAMSCTVEFSTDLYEVPTVRRFLGNFRTLLENIAANPDRGIDDQPLLPVAEWKLLFEEWNDTDVEYQRDLCLHQIIEQQVEKTPDAPALIFESQQLTYRELNARTNQLAHRLRRFGVEPNSLVGIFAERSIEMVVGLLGVMKAGGAYVPLDPEHPRERLATEIEDIAPAVLLTQEALLGLLPAQNVPVICLDRDWDTVAPEADSNPPCVTNGRDQCYVIFTSGSTGKPKGVPNIHQGIVNRLLWMQHEYKLDSTDRVMQKTPYTFDVSVWEFFWPLMTGACLVLARPQGHKDADYLVDLIEQQEITTMHFVPSMLRVFLDAGNLRRCTSLRRVICSGEALPFELQQRFFEALPDTELHNLYGPTEASVDVTYWKCQPATDHSIVPIGRPIWNTKIYILDERLQAMPIGIPGELHIGGVGLAQGYLNRPDLTEENFIRDPFSKDPSARFYKTGDVARWLPDGNLEYLGRLDQQVKLRGFRIELGEIESVLVKHASVEQCLVMAREDEPGLKRLVAYLVPAEAERVNEKSLRKHLQHSLPDYMVPAAFVLLDAFPLSSNGKIDRKALPVPEYQGGLEEFVRPRNPIEDVVAGIWVEVLHLTRIGMKDSFFHVGGDSLLATRVISRIRQTFGMELPLRGLFESPTVAGLAAVIERSGQGEAQAPPMLPVSRDQPLPLSFAQQRLWFLNQLEPDNPFYNLPQGLRICGELNRAALDKGLAEIVRRHEVLRTTYKTIDGSAVQVVAPKPNLKIDTADLTHLPESERQAEARRFAEEEARRPFKLDEGPVMRAFLLKVAEDEHMLILNTHHIASDGWSAEVFVRELGQLYSAFVQGKPSPLPELPLQYADFALWQRNWIQGQALERHLAYWRKQLAGAPATLELPTDRPRPEVQTYRGETRSMRLPVDLQQGLKKLSQREGATLYMTVLAAFQTLLCRYTGQEDIVVGSAIANRNRAEIEDLIGFFVNTLAMRTNLSGNPAFRELVGRVREVALEAYAHQDLPFEKLVEEFDPGRGLGRNPLFQVLLVLQNAPEFTLDLPGLELEWFDIHNGTSKFDLLLQVVESADGLDCMFEFNSDLFDAATIERMLGHFRTLLMAVVADPNLRIADLPILTAQERHKLLVEFNDTGVNFAPEKCIHEMVESQVERTPDNIALVFENQRLTYRQLNQRANQLAHFLRKNGVGPETLVGMYMERSLEMVIGIVGILKAGGAYLPLDIAYPPERLAFMIDDAKPPIVLTQSHLKERLPQGTRMVCLDRDWPTIAQESIKNPPSGAGPRNLAYVIYTSGSTGKPKGCLVTHYDVVRLFQASWDWFKFDEHDVWTMFHSYAFDFSVWEMWGAMFYGGTVIVVPYLLSRSPEDFYKVLTEEKVTILNQTPSAFRQVIQAEENVGERKLALRLVILGGEALEMQSLKPWFERHGDQTPRVINGYGITETTVFVSFRPVSLADTDGASLIGTPIPDMRLYFLDRYRQPVPMGVPGEMYVGGAGVARGYLNRPELTAERYLADPFSTQPGARMYRSGDLARFLPNGDIEYLGRIDDQVKIRGFRIELGEIENALALHPAVRHAVVLLREDSPGDKRLVAYVVPRANEHVSMGDVREHLKNTLPEYMVPAALVELNSLPLTINGKVDRRALSAPDASSPEARSDYAAPEGPIEEAIASVFGELLKVERVGRDDSFFELGGHSLAAAQVVTRVKQLLQVRIPLRTILEVPRVAALASYVEKLRPSIQSAEAPRIVAGKKRHGVPLSIAQEALWYEHQVNPESPVYNVPLLSRLHGDLDPAALEKAIFALVERHELLRSAILTVGGSPVLFPLKQWRGKLQQWDLRHFDQTSREAEARRLVKEESVKPFDLARDPLLRCLLIRLSDDEWLFLHNSPHIVFDGGSLDVLYFELAAFYDAFTAGKSAELPELPFQFADFATWQRRLLQGEYLNSLNEYWRQQLTGAPPVDLPSDYPRPAIHRHLGSFQFFSMPAELLSAIGQFAQRAGTTAFRCLYAAFNVFLHCYTGVDDICVGSPMAPMNPGCRGVENLIGYFINTVVLRTSLAGDPSYREVVRRAEEVVDGAIAHADLPLNKVAETLQLKRDPSRPVLFQINFRVLNQSIPRMRLGQASADPPVFVDNGTSKFDLALEIDPAEGTACFEYRTDLFCEETILQMEQDFEAILRDLIAAPEVPLSNVRAVAQITRRIQKQALASAS